MSLLLDALKKAAQKKAKKDGALNESIDPTEVVDDESTVALTQLDDTALTETVADLESTHVQETTENIWFHSS